MDFLFINFLPALLVEVAIATVGMSTITYFIEWFIQSRNTKDKSEVIIKVDGEKFSSIFIDDKEYSASKINEEVAKATSSVDKSKKIQITLK